MRVSSVIPIRTDFVANNFAENLDRAVVMYYVDADVRWRSPARIKPPRGRAIGAHRARR